MLEDHTLVTRIVSRFHIIVTVVVALLAAAFLGISAGEGDFFSIYLAFFGAAFVALVLALGDKYWLIIPFAFTSQLPAIPIKERLLELPELASALCSVVFLARYAVRRQALNIFRREHAAVLVYVAWVMMVFALNPVGLSDAGAALGGARFYAKILLALASFLIMANQVVTENDAKWVMIIVLLGSVLSSVYNISIFFLPVGLGGGVSLGSDPDDFYSWHQALATVPMILITFCFARYKASELFSFNRLWVVALFALCILLIALSGKRTVIGSVVVVMIVASVLRKEWGFLMLWLAGAAIASGIIVIGHNNLFKFPLVAQRAFSFLPASWDSDLQSMEGGTDVFRSELRRLAWQKIEKDPWIGTGYQVDLSLAQALTAQYATRGGNTELQVMPFAMGSAWHNTWLGFSADFGIPLAGVAAWIYLSVTLRGIKLFRKLSIHSYSGMLSTYILLLNVRILAFTHVGGHTALTPFELWWIYGLQVALLVKPPAKREEPQFLNRVNNKVSWRPRHASRPSPQFR